MTEHYHVYTECIQCHQEINVTRCVIINTGGDRQNSLCWTCFTRLTNDATVGQFIRIKCPRLYNEIISVPPGKLDDAAITIEEVKE